MIKILIIYATVGGNTELVIEKVTQIFNYQKVSKNLELQITSKRVDLANANEILDSDLTILASPTYGQGTVEAHFLPFIKQMNKLELNNSKLAVIGLGSPRFYPEYLTESAGILELEIKKSNGNLIVPSLRIGGEVLKMLDKLVPNWTNKLLDKLLEIKN